ncbi:MAG: N-formylglutamate amidohydrolase [bacterium]
MKGKYPVLISIPHGGVEIPSEVKDDININYRNISDDGDAFTNDIYNLHSEVEMVVDTTVARAVVDLNRSPEDLPPENPDGVIKTETVQGIPIYKEGRTLNEKVRNILLKKYYFPYHEKLEIHSSKPSIELAVDCHSMAAFGPVSARDAGEKRPLICISNRGNEAGAAFEGERVTSSQDLINELRQGLAVAFSNEDLEVVIKLNKPFGGGYIVQKHSKNGLPWLQLEINRSLYLSSKWFDKNTLVVNPARIMYLRKKILKGIKYLFD